MARRGGELEAFIAFGAGGTAALALWLALRGAARLAGLPHRGVLLVLSAAGAGCAVLVYRALRAPEAARQARDLSSLRQLKERQDSKSRAASSS
ncbi:hypothetical protein AB0D08_09300 [Kitasatospora sp. NPDC048540]|uniref:hypothetical protein n=1 Tax=unclassified Kitasatospora TaxID=2633591 RepID=UPI00053AB21B|nr:hypothetical protein [Kitasatospora sp. MBT63]